MIKTKNNSSVLKDDKTFDGYLSVKSISKEKSFLISACYFIRKAHRFRWRFKCKSFIGADPIKIEFLTAISVLVYCQDGADVTIHSHNKSFVDSFDSLPSTYPQLQARYLSECQRMKSVKVVYDTDSEMSTHCQRMTDIIAFIGGNSFWRLLV